MAIPTIYCDKKQALPGEEITVIASIGTGEWQFPNALSGDIEIISGTLDSNVLTFKCLNIYDPLIVSFLVIENKVVNGASWKDTVNVDILGDNWTTPSGQENEILEGWNFEGRSQRVNQITSGVPSISQADLTVSGEQYKVEIDYRAYEDIELKVGGHTFELARTAEGPTFLVYPIVHESGLVDFEATNGGNIKWLLSDGSVDYDTNVSKEIIGGTSYLIMDSFVGQSIGSGVTNLNYVGSLSDIPSGLSIIELPNTSVVGDISELEHIQDVVNLSGSVGVSGDIIELANVSSVISLNGCSDVYGDISNLDYTDRIELDGTTVTGIVNPTAEATHWSLNSTNLNKSQLESSLVNIANYAVSNSVSGGYFECYTDMPTVDSSSACDALSDLDILEWYVMVHSNCDGSGV